MTYIDSLKHNEYNYKRVELNRKQRSENSPVFGQETVKDEIGDKLTKSGVQKQEQSEKSNINTYSNLASVVSSGLISCFTKGTGKGLILSALIGGATKILVNGVGAKINNEEYSYSEGLNDLLTGSATGLATGCAVTGMKKIKSKMFPKVYTKEDCNVVRLDNDDMTEVLKNTIGKRKYRIATSGYSLDVDGYSEPSKAFLKSLDKSLGSRNTGYILPPALEKGSIYDITAEVSGIGKDKTLFVTAERYYDKYLNLEHFADNVDMSKYIKTPIHVFSTPEVYTQATANASNVLVCTGGRKVAVTEIVEAIKRKSKVVLVMNECMKNGTFNAEKGEVENAAKYFIDKMITGNGCYPEVERLQLQELLRHPSRITSLVRVYPVYDEKSAIEAGERAANFIKNKTIYDYIPEELVEKRFYNI